MRNENDLNLSFLFQYLQGINMDPGAFILQECCTNAWGSIIVYATFDHASMHIVMHGGKPDYVSVLPSGFVILPDDHAPLSTEIGISSSSSMQKREGDLF